jgi:long-chain acyl-CoA synthetase
MRLDSLLASYAGQTPDTTALVFGNRRVNYRDLHQAAFAIAGGLHKEGVGPGDRVLVYLPNCVEFVEVFFATFMLGAIVVPVNTRLTAKELAYFVQNSQPSALFIHSEAWEGLRDIAADISGPKWYVVGKPVSDAEAYSNLLTHEVVKLPDVPVSVEDCMILYTSGTTGKPKGAIITSANVIVQHYFLNAIDWGIGRNDCFLVTTPLAHRTGLARLMNALCLGTTVVVMERFDPEAALELIEREKITAVGMVPTVARMLMPSMKAHTDRCRSLRHIIVTGEAFPVGLKKMLIELLPNVQLHSFFAMTEVGSITLLKHEEQFTHAASVGRPTPGVEVRLLDDAGNDVPVGEVGEVLARSGMPGRYTTMRGYYNLPAETAKTIVDGWIHTGDMGRFDEDGYLYVVDRKKDMVLSGGFNIYTKEVEQALFEHPAVADAAVVGVPDETYGEAVVAFIKVRDGCTLGAEEVIEHCRSRIASYKKPKHVFFIETLPRNSLGKTLKTELRKTALHNLATKGA